MMHHLPIRVLALAVIGFAAITSQSAAQEEQYQGTCVAQCTNTAQFCATLHGGSAWEYTTLCTELGNCPETQPYWLLCHRA